MQRYKSIRVVEAFRISEIENGKLYDSEGNGYKPIADDFFQRHSPYVGAWMLFYPDGYQSICPDESFRDGYVEVGPDGEEVAAGVSTEATKVTVGPVVLGSDVLVSDAGLSAEASKALIAAGFFAVGTVREAFVSKLEDGGVLLDLPGVDEGNASEIEAILLNDRPPGNYLTGESAGEVPVSSDDA